MRSPSRDGWRGFLSLVAGCIATLSKIHPTPKLGQVSRISFVQAGPNSYLALKVNVPHRCIMHEGDNQHEPREDRRRSRWLLTSPVPQPSLHPIRG